MGNICIIGGINISIQAISKKSLKNEDSILGNISLHIGGVAYNMACKLAEFGHKVNFITIISNDYIGKKVLEEMHKYNIETNGSIIQDKWSSFYVDIIDSENHFGVNDMEILKKVSPEYIIKCNKLINNNDYIVIDTNLEQKTIEAIIKNTKVQIVCDATSVTKCHRIKNLLNKINILKLNYFEACELFGITTGSICQPYKIIEAVKAFDINEVYITLGKMGSIYLNKEINIQNINDFCHEYQNSVGAGDVFTAAVVDGYINNYTVNAILEHASGESEKFLKKINFLS